MCRAVCHSYVRDSAACHFVQWPAENIILFGYSIGTGPCTHLAAHHAVGGLFLYTSIRDMVACVVPWKVGGGRVCGAAQFEARLHIPR